MPIYRYPFPKTLHIPLSPSLLVALFYSQTLHAARLKKLRRSDSEAVASISAALRSQEFEQALTMSLTALQKFSMMTNVFGLFRESPTRKLENQGLLFRHSSVR